MTHSASVVAVKQENNKRCQKKPQNRNQQDLVVALAPAPKYLLMGRCVGTRQGSGHPKILLAVVKSSDCILTAVVYSSKVKA